MVGFGHGFWINSMRACKFFNWNPALRAPREFAVQEQTAVDFPSIRWAPQLEHSSALRVLWEAGWLTQDAALVWATTLCQEKGVNVFFPPSWLPPGRSTCLKACCNGINYLTKACVGRSCRVAAKVTGGGPIHSPICCHDHPENKPKQSKQKHKQKPPQTKNKQKQKQTKQKPKRTPSNDVTATSCGWKRWIRARGDSLVSSQIMHDDSFVPW